MKIKIYLTLGLFFVLATSMMPTSASVVITENFDGDLTGWDLYSSTRDIDGDGVFHIKTTEINNDNGVLQFPETCCNFDDVHMGFIDSTVAYGTWSVDWKISDTGNSYSLIAMMKDNITNYNFDGYNEGDLRMEGYVIILASDSDNGFWDTPGIYFGKYLGNDATSLLGTLKEYQFKENKTGWHHIDVVRSESGNFSVLFDQEYVFSYTDNEWKVTEKFVLGNFNAGTAFDNLRISNTMDLNPDDYPHFDAPPVNTTTTDTESTTTSSGPESTDDDSPISLEFFFVSFIATVIIRRKLKNI